jgi:hypothetical protein
MDISDLPMADRHSSGADSTGKVQSAALLRLAHATIGLSQLAPRLAELAASRQAEAERQAERARNIAGLTRQMTTTLENTVRVLRVSSAEIAKLTELIRGIALQTKVVAFNTRVAAARAGLVGKEFSILSSEIGSLSENTTAAARHVENRIGELQESTQRTAQVVGLEKSANDGGQGLAWLLERMGEAEASAMRQAEEARELTTMGGRVRGLSEEMIGSVGAFRLDAHRRAETLIDELRDDAGLCSTEPQRQARTLRQALDRCRFIELAYATDMRGIQITDNIARSAFSASYGDSGAGKDWSKRPWFRGALRTDGVFSSDIYRSAATDEFCLTVSATFGPRDGPALGVVAMDVNFRQILGSSG